MRTLFLTLLGQFDESSGTRVGLTSVAELVSDKIVALLQGSESNFTSAGREDIDVRMLGSGRLSISYRAFLGSYTK